MTESKYGTSWSRDELVLALYLYCQIPFAKTKANNPEVIHLAEILRRTPSAVARKLGNFGAFDPLLAKNGISGLTHFSKADREIWNNFHHRWDLLVEESQQILSKLQVPKVKYVSDETRIISQPGGTTQKQETVLVRLGQSFFRRAVLSSYDYSCCICGIDIPALLIGSHIIPWSVNDQQRTDPENGLCLCALHDKAFDRGLVSVSENLNILVSSTVAKSRCDFTKTAITNFSGKKICLPNRFSPNYECLSWHVENVFQR